MNNKLHRIVYPASMYNRMSPLTATVLPPMMMKSTQLDALQNPAKGTVQDLSDRVYRNILGAFLHSLPISCRKLYFKD
jgi:hypothetical protein